MRNNQTRYYSNGKLISWIIKNCKDCGRFLNKYDHIYCSKCHDKRNNERSIKRYYKIRENLEFKEIHRLRAKIRYDPEKYNMGDYV